mmetsp:Transcript_17720/g.40019  ORF Transcript_17720/g.40019 Transcript_17720/m.40019 type:complete len:255 (+) Transcript_17720:1223-1987(+)
MWPGSHPPDLGPAASRRKHRRASAALALERRARRRPNARAAATGAGSSSRGGRRSASCPPLRRRAAPASRARRAPPGCARGSAPPGRPHPAPASHGRGPCAIARSRGGRLAHSAHSGGRLANCLASCSVSCPAAAAAAHVVDHPAGCPGASRRRDLPSKTACPTSPAWGSRRAPLSSRTGLSGWPWTRTPPSASPFPPARRPMRASAPGRPPGPCRGRRAMEPNWARAAAAPRRPRAAGHSPASRRRRLPTALA